MHAYASHDIRPVPGKTRPDWFCMEDYRVFWSGNLTEWTDHGVILTQTSVPWADPAAYSMWWAPGCAFRYGRYYLYFPVRAKDGEFAIGVAASESPTGPFTREPDPIRGVRGVADRFRF